MSLQNFVNTTRFSNQMQTDPQTRSTVAQFFGDPDARSFVQENGNVGNALSKLDGAPQFDPASGGILFDPAKSQQQDIALNFNPMITKTVPHSDMGDRFRSAEDPRFAPPEAPSMITPVERAPQAPPHIGSAIQPNYDVHDPSMPYSREDYLRQNPATIPNRPVSELDALSPKRKALALAFQGLSKFGDSLARVQNGAADQFFGRVAKTRQDQLDYDTNRPAMQRAADDASYSRYLQGMQDRGQVEHQALLNNDMRGGLGPNQVQARGQMMQVIDQAGREWLTGQWTTNPEGFQRAVMNRIAMIPHADPNIVTASLNDIMNMPVSKYTVEYSKDGGVPIGIRAGNRLIAPEQIPSLGDKDAATLWQTAQNGYQQSRADRERQAMMMGQIRGDSMANSRFVVVTDTRTGQTRVVTGPQAVALTSDPQSPYWGGSSDRIDKARQRWAMFGDITSAANQLNAALPQQPMSGKSIARISMAVQEYHGPLENFFKSQFIKGMNQQEQMAAAALLQARDQIILLPSTMGMQPSDPRIQSLWNALPTPADLANPDYALKKTAGFYRAIHNLQQGFAGSPETFGVDRQEVPNMNNGNQGAPQTRRRRVGNVTQVQQLVNGKWVDVPPTQ